MSQVLAMGFVGLVALEHVFFLILESFLWKTPFGRRIFAMSQDQANLTGVLALNQGLYNGFLAAGLAWSLVHPDPAVARSLQVFFLGCVVVAGVVGGMTVKPTIFLIQALPAAIALALVVLR